MLSAIDTNVISALWSKEPASEGITALLFKARQQGGLLICAPVYAELLAYPTANLSFVNRFLKDTHIQISFDLSEQVWSEAGLAFAAYATRRRKAKAQHPKRMLTDFIIGAHALYQADRLLSLDLNRYVTGFPSLPIISNVSELASS